LRRPLASRPLDILWIAFFALHLSASLLIDSQAFVPRRLVPAPLSRLLQQYLADSRDPLITAALRRDPSYAWFITALALELCVQCPAFAAGIWGLWKGECPKALEGGGGGGGRGRAFPRQDKRTGGSVPQSASCQSVADA
jgi:hypothetical protein